jgi:hypothetical protein
MIQAMISKRMSCRQNTGDTMQRRKNGFGSYVVTLFAAALLLLSVGEARAAQPSATQAASQDAAVPKLAGQWQLNKDQSDDPRQKMQEARGDSAGGPGDGNGAGRHQGGQNGEGRGQGGGMMAELSVLQIEQTGSNVKITGKTGRTLAQYPASDQSDAKSAGGEGRGQSASTSQWQNGQLIVVSDGPRGKSTRTYSLSPDGKQLFVTTKMENERFKQPAIYKTVYDPATSKAGGN